MGILHLIIAAAEFVLSLLLFHQMLAALATHGRRCALRLWLIAMSLALVSLGLLTSFMEGADRPLIGTIGHVCLVVYAAMRYEASRRNHGQPSAIYSAAPAKGRR